MTSIDELTEAYGRIPDPEISAETWASVHSQFTRPTTDRAFYTFIALIIERHKAALSAIIASRKAVVPLVWRSKENYSTAETPFGEYTVTRYEESDGIGWEAVYQDAEVIGTFPTEADARNACDALHAKRINSALAAPVRDETEPGRPNGADAPLTISVENGVLLSITVGAGVLVNAVKYDPTLVAFDKQGESYEPEVTDVARWLEELAQSLRSEEEDGTTLVHRMLDKAAIEAIERGAEGIKTGDDLKDEAIRALSQTSKPEVETR